MTDQTLEQVIAGIVPAVTPGSVLDPYDLAVN
jgi:hypothetical protein